MVGKMSLRRSVPWTMGLALLLVCRVAGRVVLDGLQRYGGGPVPIYLPVRYRIVNAESAFFLQEANQDLMRNSSLQARTESFFVHQARRMPFVNASYGPLSVQQPLPLDLLQTSPGPFNGPPFAPPSPSSSPPSPPPLFTLNWKVHTYIISERVHPSWPKVQVLFYVAGRDWDDYSADVRNSELPCVRMFAFHETQEVRGTCRLEGELGLCVAELEPLAGWFSPPPAVRPAGRQRAAAAASEHEASDQGTPVELYYVVQSSSSSGRSGGGDCGSEGSRKVHAEPAGYFAGPTAMQRIGSVRLFQPLSELRLDDNFVVVVPSKPVRQRETVSTFLSLSALSSVQIFTLRVKLKDGVTFLGARASNPVAWTVSQDVRSEGHRVVTLHCRRKDGNFAQRGAAGDQRVLQVDLEVNGGGVVTPPLLPPGGGGGREVTWQVEYPLSRTLSGEVRTLIRLAPQGLVGGIVPLAMDTEILNTAVLTGRTVAVPVKVVTVGSDGTVSDVTESVECRSTDEEAVKVSERCDYVYVNGKETRGRTKVLLNFTYSFLSAQLEVSVWTPRLPLQIHLSDSELSQIKGWRVPVSTGSRRYERVSDAKDGGDAGGEGVCTAQYQSTSVRVLAHFVANTGERRTVGGGGEEEEEEGGEGEDGDELGQQQVDFLLGSDWQVDVTELVWDSLKVEDPKVAQLQEGRVLIGRSPGSTRIQVLSPLSSSVLAEQSFRVMEDRVSVTELGVQLVSGLSLSLQLSPGSDRAILATATTQEVMHALKQESLLSAWLQFSDGSVTPLDSYDPAHFVLSATSLDERVVAVRQQQRDADAAAAAWKWPVVVAEGEGQGLLVRVEMSQAEACRPKGRRRTVLAAGVGSVRVRVGRSPEDSPFNRPPGAPGGGDRQKTTRHPDSPYYGGSFSDMEAGIVNRGATTGVKGHMPVAVRPNVGGRLSSAPDSGVGGGRVDFSEYPNQAVVAAAVPPGHGGTGTEEDVSSRRGLTDLEIGMYALLGVFCLAILVFLINCISYAYKYRSKHVSVETPEAMPGPHAHDWVWLGQEEGLCLQQQQQQQEELGAHRGSLEEGSQLLNGGGGALMRGSGSESLNSPTTKRKRVKFTTFANARPRANGCPVLMSPLALQVQTSGDIKWVCSPDIQLGDSQELRDYMERLNENAAKNIV